MVTSADVGVLIDVYKAGSAMMHDEDDGDKWYDVGITSVRRYADDSIKRLVEDGMVRIYGSSSCPGRKNMSLTSDGRNCAIAELVKEELGGYA